MINTKVINKIFENDSIIKSSLFIIQLMLKTVSFGSCVLKSLSWKHCGKYICNQNIPSPPSANHRTGTCQLHCQTFYLSLLSQTRELTLSVQLQCTGARSVVSEGLRQIPYNLLTSAIWNIIELKLYHNKIDVLFLSMLRPAEKTLMALTTHHCSIVFLFLFILSNIQSAQAEQRTAWTIKTNDSLNSLGTRVFNFDIPSSKGCSFVMFIDKGMLLMRKNFNMTQGLWWKWIDSSNLRIMMPSSGSHIGLHNLYILFHIFLSCFNFLFKKNLFAIKWKLFI